MKWFGFRCGMVALSLVATSAVARGGTARRPNVVLILADDMGWTDAGCFGSDFYQTPHIDRLAAEGVKFTDSYAACHVCSPTRASIMTGKYPARLHLTSYIPGYRDGLLKSPPWTKFLPLKEVTIAERLASKGYVCGHFGKWHLNKDKNYRPGRPGDPGSQGFDTVLTTVKPRRDAAPKDAHHVRQITDAAIAFMQQNRERPFFCYVSHNTLHRPVIGSPKLVERYQQHIRHGSSDDNPIYAAMVDELDRSVGRIMSTLARLGIADETLLIFTSDNGGFLGDAKDHGTSNAPLRGGKGTNYEGGVRVPTIIRWPPATKPGTVCHEPIISNDFFATLDEVSQASGDEPAKKTWDGVSLLPLLRNPASRLGRDALFWHFPHYHAQGATPHGAIRLGNWKLIEFYEDMHVELYDLSHDVGEQHDLARQMPEKAASLRQRLHQWREEVGAQMPLRRD